MSAIRLLLVDDEPLARSRLKALLADIESPTCVVQASAGSAVEAMTVLQHQSIDGVLLDINMPGADGLQLAAQIAKMLPAPVVIFVTAHRERAVDAFEVNAADYLTKPVRLERLQAALSRMADRLAIRQAPANTHGPSLEAALLIAERGRTERVPIADVLLIRAEQKYLTVCTALAEHLLEGSLNELELKHPNVWLRVHRNALVAKAAVRALERHKDPDDAQDGWALRLDGIDQPVAVSRRQLPTVRELLSQGATAAS